MSRSKRISLFLMVLLYVAAGINHFLNEPVYEAIMPPYIFRHELLVYISGICEILFGLLLIPAATRATAARLIILLLIAIYPANIQMAINYRHTHDPNFWISVIRLPVQFVLIWWAWTFTKSQRSKVKS